MRRGEIEPLTQAEKDAIIRRAGDRTVEFFFERDRDGKLRCTRARIPSQWEDRP